jgi:hypothetical protein
MLAARKHMTLSEYFLSMVKSDIAAMPKAPSKTKKAKTPNKKTLEAMKELDEGGGYSFDSFDDFWKQMGIDPNA